jgi:hypothetical protein
MNSYLERLQQELEDATRGVSAAAMVQAASGKWNGAQILEHLFLTYHHTNRGLEKCLQAGAPLSVRRASLREWVRRVAVLKFGYFPEGRKSPERALPRGMPIEELAPAIAPEIQTMAAGFDDCERRFGARTRILDHPILGPLTAEEWRKFHWIHGRHHARQMRERMGKA